MNINIHDVEVITTKIRYLERENGEPFFVKDITIKNNEVTVTISLFGKNKESLKIK